jgi:purine-nucleoside phosphorylase
MSEAYDKNYIKGALATARKLKLPVQNGVLSTAKGPTYETAAEIRMARISGGDAATMSTVPEVIAARQQNMRVLGISCITNMATGISENKLNHEEVQETANRIKDQFIKLIKGILHNIEKW